jgi:hypothetical protein
MHATRLTRAIIRLSTTLIAHLALQSRQRAPLTRLDDDFFAALVREMKGAGLSHRIVADMLGISSRTYFARARKLAIASDSNDPDLWMALLLFIEQEGAVGQRALSTHFPTHAPAKLRATLNRMLRAEVLERHVAGSSRVFRVIPDPMITNDANQGPPTSHEGIREHYAAVVAAITRKLKSSHARSETKDVVGGATLTFEIHAGHPLRDEVRQLLQKAEQDLRGLAALVNSHNAAHPISSEQKETVSFYCGQFTHQKEPSRPTPNTKKGRRKKRLPTD